MLRTFGSDLTSLINTVPGWKVSKGSRSASRRAKKTVFKSLKNSSGVICRSPKCSNMPVSESEKHGVSVLGCRFSEKAEHVPIKKRRFLLRNLSPPPPPPQPPQPVISSQTNEEKSDLKKSQNASNKVTAAQSVASDFKSQIIVNNSNCPANKSEKANEKIGEVEDFSGISILAAAACSSSLGRECGYAEDGSGVEESSMQEPARELCANTEERSSSRGLLKEDLVYSSEMSTGGTSSCVSTEPVGELASMSTAVNSSQDVPTDRKVLKAASLGASSLTLSWDVSNSKDGGTVGDQRLSSRDGRLHWDLNVVMDAWDTPFDGSDAQDNIPQKKSQDGEKYKHEENEASFDHDSRNNMATTSVRQNSLQPVELKTLSNHTLKANTEYHEKSLIPNCKDGMDVEFRGEDTKCMHHAEIVNRTDRYVVAAADCVSLPSASLTTIKEEDSSANSLKSTGDRHCNGRPTLEGLDSLPDASPFGLENLRNACKSDATSGTASADMQITLSVSSHSDIRREHTPNIAIFENLETSQGLHDDGAAVTEKFGLKASESLEHAHAISTGNSVLCSTTSAKASDSASTKCELPVALDTKMQHVSDNEGRNVPCNDESTMNLAEVPQVISQKTTDSVCQDTCKAHLDNNSKLSDGIDAPKPLANNDVCYHPVSVVGTDASRELQEDYDSQYEDGELIETNERVWDEHSADRQAEHVDFGSNNRKTCTNPTDYPVSESGQVEDDQVGVGDVHVVSSGVDNVDNEVSGTAGKRVGEDVAIDEDNKIISSDAVDDKVKSPRSKELFESSKISSDMATGVRDYYGENLSMSNDRLEDSRGAESRAESNSFRRGLRSRIEGPVAHDVSSKEEHLNKPGSRYEESGSMRPFERVRYPYNSGRGRQNENWYGFSDGRRGVRRHFSPIVHGRSKLDDDATVGRDDTECGDARNDLSYSHQLHQKNRSGNDEDACAGLHSRCNPDRKFSPDRAPSFGRGRSFRYGPLAESRGRGRYGGPSPDESFQSSLKYRRPLSRRERSISPFGGRGHSNMHHSRGKSPSPSRSRSPIMWQSQRGRYGPGSRGNTFFRHRSRSPNFRPEGRVQRLRSPHHQPGFGADHAMGFRPNPRNHSSPPRGRWTSNRKDDSGPFREFGYKPRTSALERSPGRIRLRDDRAGVTDTPRNFKADGYYRIPDRMSEDAGGRGIRYEDNYEDRRKHFGPFRSSRRSYDDGMASRLHQDNDGNFPVANSTWDRDTSSFQGRGLRGTNCRVGDPPRRLREEQRSFIYERDGKFNSSPKQFGDNVVDSAHNVQCEEQYPSTHSGRFSQMEGANRGRRYENFDDRRNRYGSANFIRRSDLEGTETRLNHHVDENFQDAPEFRCNKGTRNFDGRISSLSTRCGEGQDPGVCGQDEKLDDNPQSVVTQNSDDNDAVKKE